MTGNPSINHISYDHRNLPVSLELENGQQVLAAYNANGRRILKESSGGAWTFYVVDGLQTLAVITEQGLSHMNLVGGGTFGRIVTNGSGNITTSNTRYYHITDHLGSTRAVVNNSGSLIETFDYYPFGLLMPKRNTASAETREKFTGHERDDEVGLDYMVWRRYDPALGRFLSVDPLADKFPEWSSYTYTLNNPINFIDPDGRASRPIGNAFSSVRSTMTSIMAIAGDKNAQAELKLRAQLVIVAASAKAAPVATGLAIGADIVMNSSGNVDGSAARAGTAGAVMKLGNAKSTAGSIAIGAAGEILGGFGERALSNDSAVLDGDAIIQDLISGGITGSFSNLLESKLGTEAAEGLRRSLLQGSSELTEALLGEVLEPLLDFLLNDESLKHQFRDRDIVETDKTRVPLLLNQ